MILADKITQLRKKAGWSQEELAEQLGVSRQSVSKWEGAQSIPDMNKILAISRLFGVSVDYLVKDELEEEEAVLPAEDFAAEPIRRVTIAEAREYLALCRKTSVRLAFGVMLCILSPVVLILLSGIAEYGTLSINLAIGLGLPVLLGMVAAAVAIFISSGDKSAPYEYLETETIETEYGVDGMVKEQKKNYRDTYTRKNIVGVMLCILGVVPLVSISIATQNPLHSVFGVCFLLALVSAGVYQFVRGGIIWESYEKLLQEGDYTPAKKRTDRRIGSVYWPIVVAVYLGCSFITNDWARSWGIWPVAGILWVAVSAAASQKK